MQILQRWQLRSETCTDTFKLISTMLWLRDNHFCFSFKTNFISSVRPESHLLNPIFLHFLKFSQVIKLLHMKLGDLLFNHALDDPVTLNCLKQNKQCHYNVHRPLHWHDQHTFVKQQHQCQRKLENKSENPEASKLRNLIRK